MSESENEMYRKVFQQFYRKLVQVLPMDDTIFIASLYSANLLPGDLKNTIESKNTSADKADCLLTRQLQRDLGQDDTTSFDKLLQLMRDNENDGVKKLALEITRALERPINTDITTEMQPLMRQSLPPGGIGAQSLMNAETTSEQHLLPHKIPNENELISGLISSNKRKRAIEGLCASNASSLSTAENLLTLPDSSTSECHQEVFSGPKKKQKHDDTELSEMIAIPLNVVVQLPDGKAIRKYQNELATPGMEGRNCIVVAPTGTGKTLVACMIISANLKRHGLKGKVLFLVTKVPLANQQCEELKRHIKGARIMIVTGESRNSLSLSTLLSTHEIVVCTADLLKNDLHTGNVLLKDISLIVFDECHHCKGQSTYSFIMTEYLKRKFKGGEIQLPQIVGLTASPGAGDSRKPNFSKTVDHLMKMGAMMDAEAGYITVEKNVTELLQYSPKIKFTKVPLLGRRSDDSFQALLVKCMKKLDSVIQEVTGKSASHEVTHQGYINFLSACLQESKLRSEDPIKERNIRAIIEHIQYYAKILHYYFDYEYDDTLSVMHNKLRSPEPDRATQVERQLQVLFESFCQEANQVSKTTNPKLEKLKSLLLESFLGQTTSKRAIVFVTEVENAISMKKWIQKQPELNGCIQPGVVTGHSREESKGMTHEEQNAVIKNFRAGKFNLLVATSVLEEGFDVPACSLIIRYQHVTNEISLVQSKGRARAVDSQCYAIIGKGTPQELQELQNEEKNCLVCDVIEKHLPSKSDWYTKLDPIQISILETVERDERLATEQKKQNNIVDVKLLCGTCETLACHGSEIFHYGSHYVALSDGIKEKYTCKAHEKPFIRETTQIKNRIHCKECDQRWGIENYLPQQGKTYPCLSCDKFNFIIKGERHLFKKWKAVTFSVPELNC